MHGSKKYMFGLASLGISAIIFLIMKNTLHPLNFIHTKNDMRYFDISSKQKNRIFSVHLLMGAHRLLEHGESSDNDKNKQFQTILNALSKHCFTAPPLNIQKSDSLINTFPIQWYNHHRNVLIYTIWTSLYNEEEVYENISKAKHALLIHDIDTCLHILKNIPSLYMRQEALEWVEKFRSHVQNIIIIRQLITRLLKMNNSEH